MKRKNNFNEEETEILNALENGLLKKNSQSDQLIKRYSGYAENTLKKDRKINIRIARHDLESLQIKAIEEGIPYQTLITSILHKYITGRLAEKN